MSSYAFATGVRQVPTGALARHARPECSRAALDPVRARCAQRGPTRPPRAGSPPRFATSALPTPCPLKGARSLSIAFATLATPGPTVLIALRASLASTRLLPARHRATSAGTTQERMHTSNNEDILMEGCIYDNRGRYRHGTVRPLRVHKGRYYYS